MGCGRFRVTNSDVFHKSVQLSNILLQHSRAMSQKRVGRDIGQMWFLSTKSRSCTLNIFNDRLIHPTWICMWRVPARRASWLTFLLKSEKALTLSDFSCQQITQSGENLEPQASAARDFHSLMLIQCIRIFVVSLIRKDKRNGRLRFYGAGGCGARRCRASPALAQKVQFLSS